MPERFTLEGLDAVLGLMRKHGVVRFRTAIDESPMEVEFGPLPSKPGKVTPLFPDSGAFEDESGAGMCSCGHDYTDHGGGGLCLRGCKTVECAKGEVPPPADG